MSHIATAIAQRAKTRRFMLTAGQRLLDLSFVNFF